MQVEVHGRGVHGGSDGCLGAPRLASVAKPEFRSAHIGRALNLTNSPTSTYLTQHRRHG
jgi:hypothetical protein